MDVRWVGGPKQRREAWSWRYEENKTRGRFFAYDVRLEGRGASQGWGWDRRRSGGGGERNEGVVGRTARLAVGGARRGVSVQGPCGFWHTTIGPLAPPRHPAAAHLASSTAPSSQTSRP